MEEIKSNVPVMRFCEYCWATLNEDGTCPTDGCVHNELMNEVHEYETTSPAQP